MAGILIRMEGARERKFTNANGEGPTPQDQQAQEVAAISSMTINMMDQHIGKISWSFW